MKLAIPSAFERTLIYCIVSYREALFAWSYKCTFSRVGTVLVCDSRTDGHTTTAYAALAWRRAVKRIWKGLKCRPMTLKIAQGHLKWHCPIVHASLPI